MSHTKYYAHSLEDDLNPILWQLLEDHLKNVADKASEFADVFNARDWGYIAGLWHDVGKYSDAFQRRIRGSKERADHSTPGALLASNVFSDKKNFENLIGRILGYGIAGHHTGLPDGNSVDETCLNSRLHRANFDFSPCPHVLLQKQSLNIHDLKSLFSNRRDESHTAFGLAFYIRMLFSCIVDADRLDSEAFSEPEKAEQRGIYPSIRELYDRLITNLEKLSCKYPERAINKNRAAILAQCLSAANDSPGLFSLTVPTGGGKTLSSLAFALKHALKHGLARVIYVIPFTSIIEQNAKVFRENIGKDAVVEHHSNYEYQEESEDSVDQVYLASENWDAPVIVTTSVQFFESLFSHKPSRCRKLHNIVNSVVILDEAQMLPPELLLPCMEALRELTTRYNTTIVLCTATQPALNREDEFPEGFENVREIISDREILYENLKRVEIKMIGKKKDEEIAALIREHMQALCIVNTRNRARKLFELCGTQEGVYHLSASMCPTHRTQKLAEIRERLRLKKYCKVISTQLIEAGVDIDFPVVFREMTGIDSIAQAAGRCNREGRLLQHGKVFVFEPSDGTSSIFRQQAQAAQTVIRHHGDDVLSLKGIREYFQELYWTRGRERLDLLRIFELLKPGVQSMDFPFREIGEEFHLIKEDTVPVVIPWKEKGKALEKALRSEHPSRSIFRKAQRYTVSVYRQVFNQLEASGVVEKIPESVAILTNMEIYSDDLGLMLNDTYYRSPESNII